MLDRLFRRRPRGRHAAPAAPHRHHGRPATPPAGPPPAEEPPAAPGAVVALVFGDGSVLELPADDARVAAFRRAADSLVTRTGAEP